MMPSRFERPHDHAQTPRTVLLAGLGALIDPYGTGTYPGIVADLERARRELARRPVPLADRRTRKARAAG